MKKILPALAIICGAFAIFLFFSVKLDANRKLRSAVKNLKNMGDLKISSPSFQGNGKIPARYTCDGENLSPAIRIERIPDGTKSLVLIVLDPDAVGWKIWDHWLIWNISPETVLIPEDEVPAGAVLGVTSFGDKKYGGPCPPAWSGAHHYRFKLYALDSPLNLPPDSQKYQVEKAMAGHIFDEATLTGVYERA